MHGFNGFLAVLEDAFAVFSREVMLEGCFDGFFWEGFDYGGEDGVVGVALGLAVGLVVIVVVAVGLLGV